MDQPLQGKAAVVTGGAGGIGEVFCTALARAGAAVAVADLDVAGAERVAHELRAAGHRAVPVAYDQSDERSVRSMVEEAATHCGGIDVLVNVAALMDGIPKAPLVEYPIDWWERVLRVNLTGMLLCVQAAAPLMIERGGGKIVNIPSGGAFATPGNPYTISKLGVSGITVGLAKELAPHHINVNAIAPGAMETEAGFRAAPEGSPSREYLATSAMLGPSLPPSSLVGTLVLLVTSAGDWITGQTVHVDGGWIARVS